MREWHAAAQESAGMMVLPVKRRILIVDDFPTNRRVPREMLRELGHEVIEAKSTTEALSLISRDVIDLALVDRWRQRSADPPSAAFCGAIPPRSRFPSS